MYIFFIHDILSMDLSVLLHLQALRLFWRLDVYIDNYFSIGFSS